MKLPDDTELEALRKMGDAEADPLMDRIVLGYGIHAVANLLDFLFRWKPGTPLPSPCPGVPQGVVEMVAPFLADSELPDDAVHGGIDWPRIRRAQDFYQPYRLSGLMVLGCSSLPACYANPGVALVLMGSGRLSVQVRQRLSQTINFLSNVMTPGYLGPQKNALGAQWIRKVRLMHALMRKLTLANATPFGSLSEDKPSNVFLKHDWNRSSDAGVKPIDQLQLGFVLLTFSWLLVRGFGTLGINMSEAQRDDHIYTWAVVGHALGIPPELRPLDAAGACELFERIRARYEAGTEEGRLLTAALVIYVVLRQHEAVSKFLPRKRSPLLQWLIQTFKPFADGCLESLARTLVRDLAGTHTANRLWVARAPLVHWIVGEAARGAMTLAEMRGREDWLPRALGGKPREKGFPRLLGQQFANMQ